MQYHLAHIKSTAYKVAFILCIFISLINGAMKEACDLFYRGDPVELKDSTIRVPEKVMAMSEKIHVDMPPSQPAIDYSPSIFLLIQHSGSIETKDRAGKRFTFAQAIIDSVKRIYPKTEVGIGVFRTYLYFDPADNPRFAKTPGNDTGAYLQFFRLDSLYAPDGKLGYQIAHEILDTVMVNGTANLKYTPSNTSLNPANTNINCGFDAVKHAFKSSKHPKNRQFVIFFSDGEANTVNGPHTNIFEYQDSVRDVPTTITAYSSNSGTAHQSLVKMTTNIQNNGYSYQNPRAALYSISSDTLMQYVLNTISKIISPPPFSKPLDITVNGKTTNNYDTANKIFTFSDRFPLTSQSTIFNYIINYMIVRDSIDTIIGDTITIMKDSTTSGSYTVLVDPTIPNPPLNYKHLFATLFWKRELALYYNGTPVNLVNKVMNNLELRFIYSPGEAQYHYTKANIEVSNSSGAVKDKETLILAKNDTLFTKTFSLAIDSNPTPDNGVLQVRENDTIVAVFRNNETPKLPLDTIRIAVPFIATAAIQSNPIISGGTFSFNLIKNGSDNYRLKYNNLPAEGKVSLYTINGRKVFNLQLIKGSSSIELPKNVSQGIYLLQVHYSGKVSMKKVLLQ